MKHVRAVPLIAIILVAVIGVSAFAPAASLAISPEVRPSRLHAQIDRPNTTALERVIAQRSTADRGEETGADWVHVVASWLERSRFGTACVKIEFVDQAGPEQRSTLDGDVQTVGTLLDPSSAGESVLAGLPPGPALSRNVEPRSSLANPSPLLPPPRS